ncbi:MAG: hypothetical protein ACYS17_05485 [Planctomycetota bacterium]|jgi:hypothetical protein
MSEKERYKAGLHKKISSIFSGVLVPQPDGAQKPSDTSAQDDKEVKESKQQAQESGKPESPKPYQAAQILPKAEPEQESEVEHAKKTKDKAVSPSKCVKAKETKDKLVSSPKIVTAEKSKVIPVEESEVEPAKETKDKPVSTPKFITDEKSKVIPVEESEVKPAKETKDKPVSSPKIASAETPKVISVEESEVESSEEESKDKPVATPKFMTAQESKLIPIEESKVEPTTEDKSVSSPTLVTAEKPKVIPVEESEVEPAQETQDKPVSAPKFMTAQESKVIPVEESEVESDQRSETTPTNRPNLETAKQTEDKATKQPKVIPVQKPKANNSKITEKQTTVKISKQSSWKQITDKLFTSKSGDSSTKQKAMVVVMPVLFIVLLIFVFKGGIFGTSVHNVVAGEENNASGVVSASLNNQIDWKIPEPYPTTLRDPMRLGPIERTADQTESGALVKLTVKSILYSEDNSSAVIGGRIVHEGEQVRGVNIIKINKNNVEFELNGKTWSQEVKG